MGIFDFFEMMGNYDSRKVDHYSVGELEIDTARVTDSAKDYETAVSHPKYNDNKWVIVETYDTAEQAQAGHDKWVKTMTAETLPEKLVDVSSAGIAQLVDAFGDDEWREYKSA